MAEAIAGGGLLPPGGATPLLECRFDILTLSTVRRELRECVERCGLRDMDAEKFVLAVNEIATNAIRHAGGSGSLTLWAHAGHLYCRVVDRGPGIPVAWLDGTARSQRDTVPRNGLWLTRRICDSVEIDTGRSGTRVVVRYVLPTREPGGS